MLLMSLNYSTVAFQLAHIPRDHEIWSCADRAIYCTMHLIIPYKIVEATYIYSYSVNNLSHRQPSQGRHTQRQIRLVYGLLGRITHQLLTRLHLLIKKTNQKTVYHHRGLLKAEINPSALVPCSFFQHINPVLLCCFFFYLHPTQKLMRP